MRLLIVFALIFSALPLSHASAQYSASVKSADSKGSSTCCGQDKENSGNDNIDINGIRFQGINSGLSKSSGLNMDEVPGKTLKEKYKYLAANDPMGNITLDKDDTHEEIKEKLRALAEQNEIMNERNAIAYSEMTEEELEEYEQSKPSSSGTIKPNSGSPKVIYNNPNKSSYGNSNKPKRLFLNDR